MVEQTLLEEDKNYAMKNCCKRRQKIEANHEEEMNLKKINQKLKEKAYYSQKKMELKNS